MAAETQTSSGVKELISRLRDDGVRAGKNEAERIVREARGEAAKMLADARAEIEAAREKATAEVEAQSGAALEALKIAARDAVLELQSQVSANFAQHVERLVSKETRDEDLIRSLVLVLAGRAAEEHVKDKEAYILLSDSLFGSGERVDETRARTREVILGISGEMLRDGIDLIPASDLHGGARVQLVGEHLEIDLSDKSISQLMLKYMLPRFRSILAGEED